MEGQHFKCAFFIKQDHRRMNVAPEQTIIFLDHRSLSSIDQKILMTMISNWSDETFLPLGNLELRVENKG